MAGGGQACRPAAAGLSWLRQASQLAEASGGLGLHRAPPRQGAAHRRRRAWVERVCRFRRTQAGCALVLTGRREAPLQETAGLISAAGGLPALVAPADLTDAAAVEGLFAVCEREHGRLDVLFNNAGTLTLLCRQRSTSGRHPTGPYPTQAPSRPAYHLRSSAWSSGTRPSRPTSPHPSCARSTPSA